MFAWVLLLVGASLAVLSGCRTYGRYNAQEKIYPQMQQSVRLFADDLQRVRAEQTLLNKAVSGDSSLRAVGDEFQQAVQRHEEVLAQNREVISRFEDELGSYRDMRRIYGAMLSNHQAVRNRYRSLIRAVRYPGLTQTLQAPVGRSGEPPRRALPDTLPRARAENFTEGRYYVAPIFYNQLQSAGADLTMRQALAERKRRTSGAGAPGRRGGREGSALPGMSAADSVGAP